MWLQAGIFYWLVTVFAMPLQHDDNKEAFVNLLNILLSVHKAKTLPAPPMAGARQQNIPPAVSHNPSSEARFRQDLKFPENKQRVCLVVLCRASSGQSCYAIVLVKFVPALPIAVQNLLQFVTDEFFSSSKKFTCTPPRMKRMP